MEIQIVKDAFYDAIDEMDYYKEKIEILKGNFDRELNNVDEFENHLDGNNFLVRIKPYPKKADECIKILQGVTSGLNHIEGLGYNIDIDLKIYINEKRD